MKGVVYRSDNNVHFENVSDPKIADPTDAIIKVNCCAIGGADIHIKKMGLLEAGKVIGHEYCGVVTEVGQQVSGLKEGDRIIGKPFYHCGQCFWCKHGQSQLCIHAAAFGSGTIDGVQAEYARIPFADNTLKHIPDDISDEDALLMYDVLSTGYGGLARGQVVIGESVAIFGDGPIGLATAMCASMMGVGLIMVVGHHDYRLDHARKLGAVAINAASIDSVAAIKGLTEGRGADICIEAAGSEEAFQKCLQSTRRGGRINVLGRFSQPSFFDITGRSQDIFTLFIGLGGSDHVDMLLDMIKAGKLKPRTLITHHLPLSDAARGYELFEKRLDKALKVVFRC